MKFLVTGGAGFIGSHIVRYLVRLGHQVDIADNFHRGKKNSLENILDKINLFEVDIRDKHKMENIIVNYDGIFHEAALTSVPESFEKSDEYFDVNVKGTENIFQLALEKNIRVVFASSSSIYGDTEDIPIKENCQRNPTSPYGKTKLEAEVLAEKFSDLGLEVIGLRYFNVYGKGQTGHYAGVISKLLSSINQGQPLTIFGDGEQTRDFVHVRDVASVNFSLMTSKVKEGFFNIGSGQATTINELAKLMAEISGHKHGVKHLKSLEGDIRDSVADLTKIQDVIGWRHETSLEKGIRRLV